MHPNARDGYPSFTYAPASQSDMPCRALTAFYTSSSIEGQLNPSTGEGWIQDLRGALANPGDKVVLVQLGVES